MNGVAVKALAGEQQHGIFLFVVVFFFPPVSSKSFRKSASWDLVVGRLPGVTWHLHLLRSSVSLS